jgi:peptidoglycan lytic transglycosylase G
VTEMSLSDVIPGSSPQGPRRRSQRAAEKRRKKRRRRTWVTVLVILAVLGGASTGAWFAIVKPVLAAVNEPDDYPGPGAGSVLVRIPAGATGSDIATLLQSKGVVKTAKAYLKAAEDNPASASIQPGTYAMRLHMTGAGAVQALVDPAGRLVKKVTIPEGSRLKDILAKVSSDTGLKIAGLQAAAKDPSAIDLPADAKGNPEGYLFPSTYEVEPDTSAEDLLRQMVDNTLAQLEELGVPAKNYHSVLTLASIVQAEGRHPQDFGKIARVLDNRLAKNWKLQLDTTLHYATGKFTVATSEADTKYPSPYNTYIHPGLPPGPIGSPGRTALEAALKPTPGPWMYFVATNPSDGTTEFAVTAQQFAKLKVKYEAWQRAHPGQ